MKKIAVLLATVATFAALSAPADAKPRRVVRHVVIADTGAFVASAALAAAAHEARHYCHGYYYGHRYYGGPVYIGGWRW